MLPLKLTSATLTVMMSVFEGGDGSTSGGRSEKSRESGDLLPDDARERCGDGRVACMFAIICCAKSLRRLVWMSCCDELKCNVLNACVLYQSSPSRWLVVPASACKHTVAPPQSAKARTSAMTFPASTSHVLLLSRHFLGVIALPRHVASQRTVLLEVSRPRRTRQ